MSLVGVLACLATAGGPCRSPEPLAYLPGQPPVLVANFGLLLPAPDAATWQFVCDDHYGQPLPDRVWRHPRGRLFAGGRSDLLISDDEGCSFAPVAGDLPGQSASALAFDRGDPQRIWALAGDPPVLYRSLDGGDHFIRQHVFPADRQDPRLLAGPGLRLYLVSATVGATTVLDRSDDGGETWSSRELTAAIQPPPRNPLGALAVAPVRPDTIVLVIPDPAGDQLWQTADAGQSVVRLLQLRDGEVLAGFTFGAGPDSLFVAGTAPIRQAGRPPARLYRSDDGGRSWAEPIASGEDGPAYRCLGWQDGHLLACGAGESAGDRFLLGRSTDQGRSWSPVVRLADLQGARACVRERCTATELWLCDIYGRCADGPHDAGAVDGGGPDATGPGGGTPSAPGGCACRLDPSEPPPPPVLLAALAGWARALRRHRRGQVSRA